MSGTRPQEAGLRCPSSIRPGKGLSSQSGICKRSPSGEKRNRPGTFCVRGGDPRLLTSTSFWLLPDAAARFHFQPPAETQATSVTLRCSCLLSSQGFPAACPRTSLSLSFPPYVTLSFKQATSTLLIPKSSDASPQVLSFKGPDYLSPDCKPQRVNTRGVNIYLLPPHPTCPSERTGTSTSANRQPRESVCLL